MEDSEERCGSSVKGNEVVRIALSKYGINQDAGVFHWRSYSIDLFPVVRTGKEDFPEA